MRSSPGQEGSKEMSVSSSSVGRTGSAAGTATVREAETTAPRIQSEQLGS
jgi:hypothetical protein